MKIGSIRYQFDSKDSLTVNTLEAIYGQESSFGSNRRTRGISGAAGDFQVEKETAIRYGLTVSRQNDQRFDIDYTASQTAAKHLKTLDNYFREGANLGNNLNIIKIFDGNERLKFTLASYNAGEGRIAKAQAEATAHNLDPKNWHDVSTCLKDAGATLEKILEIVEYVEQVLESSKEFSEKSQADKTAKDREPLKQNISSHEHWITKDGKHIPIKD